MYKINDAEKQKRFSELLEEVISPELALSMLNLETLMNSGNPNQNAIDKAIALVSKIKNQSQIQSYKDSELLAKPALQKLFKKVCDIIVKNISGRFMGWELVIDKIGADIISELVETKNE